MSISSSVISIEPVDTQNLWENDFSDISDLTQDMWAESMKELIHCQSCWYIAGKKETLWYLPLEIYKKKVSTILNSVDPICPSCGSHQVDLMHPINQTIGLIKERLLWSLESHAVMCKNIEWELIWYAEAYFDTFHGVYKKELQPHYFGIQTDDMRSRIELILNKNISKMIVLSAFGLTMQYRNPILFAQLLKRFAESQNFTIPNAPWIIETERNSPVYKVFMWLWWIILNDIDPFFHKHNHSVAGYKGIIAVFPESMNVFSRQFIQGSVRSILKLV